MIYSVLLLNCSTVRVFNKKTNLRSDIKSDFRSDIRSVHESTHTSFAAIFSLAAFRLIGLPIACYWHEGNRAAGMKVAVLLG